MTDQRYAVTVTKKYIHKNIGPIGQGSAARAANGYLDFVLEHGCNAVRQCVTKIVSWNKQNYRPYRARLGGTGSSRVTKIVSGKKEKTFHKQVVNSLCSPNLIHFP